MEILGIGPFELVLVLLIALIVLGPGDIAKTGRTIGRFLNGIVRSDWWKGIQSASREARQLPYRLMREANLEDAAKDLKEIGKVAAEFNQIGKRVGENSPDRAPSGSSDFAGWTTPPASKPDIPVPPKKPPETTQRPGELDQSQGDE